MPFRMLGARGHLHRCFREGLALVEGNVACDLGSAFTNQLRRAPEYFRSLERRFPPPKAKRGLSGAKGAVNVLRTAARQVTQYGAVRRVEDRLPHAAIGRDKFAIDVHGKLGIRGRLAHGVLPAALIPAGTRMEFSCFTSRCRTLPRNVLKSASSAKSARRRVRSSIDSNSQK